ncbi:MAG: serine hydrolase [Ignavibacteriales bacterium]|nr:serine hydrolase [Ignavibacteriales bacterium]
MRPDHRSCRQIVLSVWFLLLISTCVLVGQEEILTRIQRVENNLLPPVLIKGEKGWVLKERMKHYMVPGVSVAVFRDFRIEWAKAYGVKDIGTNEPATPSTMFQAASISKPVAVTAALKLVEEGKLKLDDDINKILRTWKLPENEFTEKRKVTPANLMSHTAGLTVSGFPGYEPDEALPTLQQVLDGKSPANTPAVRVNLEPSTRFRYSGGGTTILQLMMMDLEGKAFDQIMKTRVLDPVGMSNSTYRQPLPEDLRSHATTAHRADGSVIKGKVHIYPEQAAAGLWTTPTDLSKFAIEIGLSLKGRSNKILKKETVERMLTPFVADNIGLGFFLDKKGNTVYFQHGGANEGFRCMLMANKEGGYGAAVMVNSDNGQIIGEIMRSIAKEYQWESYLPPEEEIFAVAESVLDRYTGRYLVNPDRVLTVRREGKRLMVDATQPPSFELLPVSERTFIRRDQVLRYTFVVSGQGSAGEMEIQTDAESNKAPRVPAHRRIPYEDLMAGNVEGALSGYRAIKREQPDNFAVSEDRLNSLGYEFLRQKKFREAVGVFSLNAELYPGSANVFDSLGEAYATSGDREGAIRSFRKVLEIDPTHANALAQLRSLGAN